MGGMNAALGSLGVLSLLALSLQADELDPLGRIAEWERQPVLCERAVLLGFLRSDDVRVRSAALDLLEDMTGRDFGLDPWLEPSQVPESVRRELDEWAAAERMLGVPLSHPDEQQLRDAMAMLRDADADTLRLVCLRFERFCDPFVQAIEREIRRHPQMPEREYDNLRLAQFRVQLGIWMPEDAPRVASLLVSHVRADVIEGLECLRATGNVTLPVVSCFAESSDSLIRETAVDIMLQLGMSRGYAYLMPQLMRESERNILQIAAAHAPDALPVVAVVHFLNHCAMLEDEDVVVSALEALRDLGPAYEEQRKELLGEGELFRFCDESDALSVEQVRRLWERPEWRVRAALINLLSTYNKRAPEAESPEMRDILFAALADESETVRQNAFRVIVEHSLMEGSRSEAMLRLAQGRPECAPLVACLFAAPLPPFEVPEGMKAVVRGFSAEQVDLLARLDGEYRRIFSRAPEGSSIGALRDVLLESEDPAVQRRLILWFGVDLATRSEAWCDRLVAWLDAPTTTRDERAGLLRSFWEARERGGSAGFSDGVASSALCDWLEAHALQQQDAQLAALSYLALVCCDDLLAGEVFERVALGLDAETLDAVVTARPEQLAYLSPSALLKLAEHSGGRGCSRIFDAIASSRAGVEALAREPLPDVIWYDGIVKKLANSLGGRIPAWCEAVLLRALDESSAPRRRAEAALLALVCCKNEDVLAAARRVVQEAAPEMRGLLSCFAAPPQRPEEVSGWLEGHADGSLAMRALTASSLLPVNHWVFRLPAGGAGERAVAVFSAPALNNDLLQRAMECPEGLLQRVEALQQDADPFVATLACASMLYRTGSCDAERFNLLLQGWLERPADDAERELIAETLNGVWRRWARYRASVPEVFVLKGNVNSIDERLAPTLLLLRALAGESWGVNNAVTDLIGKAENRTFKQTTLRPRFSLLPSEADGSASGAAAAPGAAGAAGAASGTPPGVPSDVSQGSSSGSAQGVAQGSAGAVSPAADAAPEGEAASDGAAEGAGYHPIDRSRPLRVEFFHKEHCGDCERASRLLEQLREFYPGLELVDYSIESREGYLRNDVLCRRFGVEAGRRHKAPALFTEAGCLLGEQIRESQLREMFDAALQCGGERLAASPVPEAGAASRGASVSRLSDTEAEEEAAAERSRFAELVRSYAVLALGGLVLLLVLLKLLMGRGSRRRASGGD